MPIGQVTIKQAHRLAAEAISRINTDASITYHDMISISEMHSNNSHLMLRIPRGVVRDQYIATVSCTVDFV